MWAKVFDIPRKTTQYTTYFASCSMGTIKTAWLCYKMEGVRLAPCRSATAPQKKEDTIPYFWQTPKELHNKCRQQDASEQLQCVPTTLFNDCVVRERTSSWPEPQGKRWATTKLLLPPTGRKGDTITTCVLQCVDLHLREQLPLLQLILFLLLQLSHVSFLYQKQLLSDLVFNLLHLGTNT